MNIGVRQIGSFILCTAATAFAAQSVSSDENKSDPQKSVDTLVQKENIKITFDESEVKKHIVALNSDVYRIRDTAYKKLLQLPDNLSLDDRISFSVYIMDKAINPPSEEVNTRLGRIQEKALEALEQKIISQTDTSKSKETALKLIEIMSKKRATFIWRKLTPVIVTNIANEAVISKRHTLVGVKNINTVPYSEYKEIQADRKLIKSLSGLLLSVSNNDSKELRAEAVRLSASLTKEPLHEHEAFISIYNEKLQALALSIEGKLSNLESKFKELKELHSQADLSNGLEPKLVQLAKPVLEEILEVNINAFLTNDLKKQEAAINNINFLKTQFTLLNIKDLTNSKHISLIFSKRQEFTKDITSSKELQTAIQTAISTSRLPGVGSDYHVSYINWLEKQADNPLLLKLPNRKEIQNILELALKEELYTTANSNSKILQSETINPLVKTFTKLAKQRNVDAEIPDLQAIIDFQYFSHFYLNFAEQEKLHPHMLTLFDATTEGINNLRNKEDKTSLRIQILTTLPFVNSYPPDSIVEKLGGEWILRKRESDRVTRLYREDYLSRLSKLYCKGQNKPDTEEFIRLTDGLFNSSDSEHPGKDLPPEIMLQFIENNFEYFEKNIRHIIETYKESNESAIKSASQKQLKEISLSFHRLFNEKKKASMSDKKNKKPDEDGWLTQHYPRTNVVNTSTNGSTNLRYRPDWCEQISRIEAWFYRRGLEAQIKEVISQK